MEWIEHDFVSGASFDPEKCRNSRPGIYPRRKRNVINVGFSP